MSVARLPWEIIETFPSTDADLIAHWDAAVAQSDSNASQARALIGRALSLYWATQEEVLGEVWNDVAARRIADLEAALGLARADGSPTLVAEALLGLLYGTWGPDHHLDRGPIIAELVELRTDVSEEEVGLRIWEWEVVQHFDSGDLDAVRASIAGFAAAAANTELILFQRREVLWRGCLAMLDGQIDDSLQINQDAISSTANVAGSPFSFQNVAITLAIERYLRRGLGDMVDTIRSIRASSPRVGANWDTGLAFALSEIGDIDEARTIYQSLAANRFARVPRDLNWLVTMQLLALIALTIDAAEDGPVLVELLRPFAHLDATHGSGYASYGPAGRVVGSLMARWGDASEAETVFQRVFTTRPDGPWTALARLDRAVARRSSMPAAALADAQLAEIELRRFDLTAWAECAQQLSDELALNGHGAPLALRRAGESIWTLHHPSGTATAASSIGIDHLVWLLARPGVAVNVTELDPFVDGSLQHSATQESTLDNAARTQYRRRLQVLEGQGHLSTDEDAEVGFLRRELAGAAHVVSASSELERLRVRVTKAIRRAINVLADQSPGLGAHFRATIETGRTCTYRPVDGGAWNVVRR